MMSGIGTTSSLGMNIDWVLANLIRRNRIPVGLKNNVNLTYTLPDGEVAVDGTLEVWLSCIKLPADAYTLSVDGTSFEIHLDPDDPVKLNCPPQQNEPLSVNYLLQQNC